MINWRQIGHVLTRTSQLDLDGIRASGGIFAPTLRFHNDTFYLITTCVTCGGNFYVTATNPAGPWSEPVWVDKKMFDPSLFFDDDGTVYYTRRGNWNIGGTQQAEIDIKTGKLKTPLTKIADGFVSEDQEGPHIYKKDGWYYLMCAEGGSRFTHMETIARGKNPNGPFEPCPDNPILANHSGWGDIRTTGHGDLIKDHEGNWWMVHLATRHPSYGLFSIMGRETFLLPVEWKNGWPVVNKTGKTTQKVNHKTLPLKPFADKSDSSRDEFAGDSLNLYWNFLRKPPQKSWSLAHKDGYLSLLGNQYNLDSKHSPAFVGRRMKYFHTYVETRMAFQPQSVNDEAGLTCYMRNDYHYDIFLTKRRGVSSLVVRKNVAGINKESVVYHMGKDTVTLAVQTIPYHFYLGYLNENGEFQELEKCAIQSITTEVARVWTGLYFAMYSTCSGKRCEEPACFDYFEMRKEKLKD